MNSTIVSTTREVGDSPELVRLRTFQLGRLACTLEARRAFAEMRARTEAKAFGREANQQARGLDHAAFGLHQACVALGSKEVADELVQRYRASPAPALFDLLNELRRTGQLAG